MSDCGVCLADYDGDAQLHFYDSRTVCARKSHQCSECHRTIAPGEDYERASGKWDGNFAAFKTCAVCRAISDGLSCGGGGAHGTLWGDIADQVFPDMTMACLKDIEGTAAKRYLLQRWQEWKGLTP